MIVLFLFQKNDMILFLCYVIINKFIVYIHSLNGYTIVLGKKLNLNEKKKN